MFIKRVAAGVGAGVLLAGIVAIWIGGLVDFYHFLRPVQLEAGGAGVLVALLVLAAFVTWIIGGIVAGELQRESAWRMFGFSVGIVGVIAAVMFLLDADTLSMILRLTLAPLALGMMCSALEEM